MRALISWRRSISAPCWSPRFFHCWIDFIKFADIQSIIALRLKYPLFFFAALTLLSSCVRRVEAGYDSIALVDRLVSDSLPSLQLLAGRAGKPSGTVVLVGEPLQCLTVSEKLMNCDEFDNVDARPVNDGLPDFSGETIVSLLDFTRPSFDSLSVSGKDSPALREIAVENALAALDSTLGCKLLVICSPALAPKGGEDVVDFFGKIGCDVPVVFSPDTTFSFTRACYKVLRERNLFTHNIAYPVARLMMITEGDSSRRPLLFDDNQVPESFADTVGVFAPNTYVSHVQNKHNSGRNR